MWLMTAFGISALLLAAIGVYGLIAYAIEQRTHEIGIRLALGAQVGQVKNMVVFQGMRLALAGILVGVAAAFGLARFLEAFLFGVHNRDPLVFVCVPSSSAWSPSSPPGSRPARRAGSIRSLPCGRSEE
jgi:putative ABC transport system permease protein